MIGSRGTMAKQIKTFLSMLYDFWSPHVDKDEFIFYHRLLTAATKDGGKALELSCGSGRLLLAFLKEGFDVSGIEGSKELCDLLRKRAQKANLNLNLYQMRLDNCEIKGQYNFIYSSLGSFQMLADHEDAQILLSKAYRSLSDDGVLSIALFLPWQEVSFDKDRWVIAYDKKDPNTKHRYVRREKTSQDEVEQVIEGVIRYETWLGRDLLEMDERELKLRWYSQYEFKSLLKEAGFKNIEMHRSYSENGLPRPHFMLFLARK